MSQLTELRDQLMDRWLQLEPRHQQAALLGACVLVPLLTVAGWWYPSLAAKQAAAASRVEAERVLSWVESQAGKIQSIPTTTRVRSADLPARLQAIGQQLGIVLGRLESEGSGVRTSASHVSVGMMMLLLENCQRQGINISDLSLEREADGNGFLIRLRASA